MSGEVAARPSERCFASHASMARRSYLQRWAWVCGLGTGATSWGRRPTGAPWCTVVGCQGCPQAGAGRTCGHLQSPPGLACTLWGSGTAPAAALWRARRRRNVRAGSREPGLAFGRRRWFWVRRGSRGRRGQRPGIAGCAAGLPLEPPRHRRAARRLPVPGPSALSIVQDRRGAARRRPRCQRRAASHTSSSPSDARPLSPSARCRPSSSSATSFVIARSAARRGLLVQRGDGRARLHPLLPRHLPRGRLL